MVTSFALAPTSRPASRWVRGSTATAGSGCRTSRRVANGGLNAPHAMRGRSIALGPLTFRVPPRHLYVHVPFCARRCSYCDFSIAVRREVPVAEYIDGIRRELECGRSLKRAAETKLELDTLYLGGGTPSRLGGAGIAELLATIRKHATWSETAEVTIEANPDDVTAENARAWRAAGVNRVSLGAQTFSPPALAWMHRTHDAEQIGAAVAHVRDAGIAQLSLDLIFALPPEVERDWHGDLAGALALRPDHISLYGLTVEPHTPLGHWRERGEVSETPETALRVGFSPRARHARRGGVRALRGVELRAPGRARATQLELLATRAIRRDRARGASVRRRAAKLERGPVRGVAAQAPARRGSH